jgi:hypothetical protein
MPLPPPMCVRCRLSRSSATSRRSSATRAPASAEPLPGGAITCAGKRSVRGGRSGRVPSGGEGMALARWNARSAHGGRRLVGKTADFRNARTIPGPSSAAGSRLQRDAHPAGRTGSRKTGATPRQYLRVARQLRRGNGLGVLAPAHQAGHFVGFHQPVHARPQTKLIAVFARAEISAGADREAAEGFSAELARAPVHFGSIIGVLSFNC